MSRFSHSSVNRIRIQLVISQCFSLWCDGHMVGVNKNKNKYIKVDGMAQPPYGALQGARLITRTGTCSYQGTYLVHIIRTSRPPSHGPQSISLRKAGRSITPYISSSWCGVHCVASPPSQSPVSSFQDSVSRVASPSCLRSRASKIATMLHKLWRYTKLFFTSVTLTAYCKIDILYCYHKAQKRCVHQLVFVRAQAARNVNFLTAEGFSFSFFSLFS